MQRLLSYLQKRRIAIGVLFVVLLVLFEIGRLITGLSFERGPGVNESFRSARVINLSEQGLDTTTVNTTAPSQAVALTSQYKSSDRKLITNGDLRLQVAAIDQTLSEIAKLTNEFNGYVVRSEVSGEKDARSGSIQIRIPADQFQVVFERAKVLASKVLREGVTGEDVTEKYIDLKARLASLQSTAKRTQELLVMAKTADEALRINVEMGRLQEQIDSLTGQLQYIENRVNFSTITITLETERTIPLLPTWQASATAERAFGFLAGLGRLIVDLVIWSLIVGLPILLILWSVVQLARRTRRRRQSINAPTS